MSTDIYIKVQPQDEESLLEIPHFICNWEYSQHERAHYPKELGKIVTQNYNFRFYKETPKVHNNF